jgi:hypothetical protein
MDPLIVLVDSHHNLNNRMMDQLCQQFKIQHHNSVPYRPKMNGAVEAANKNVKKILNKMIETYKDWHEHLPYALCAYRTSVRTSVGATPYSLVYGMEAVLPVEVEIPSLRIFSQTDGDQGTTSKDLIQVPIGPVTRARAKKFKDVLNGLIQELWAQANSWRPIEHDPPGQQRIVTLIQVLEGSGQG